MELEYSYILGKASKLRITSFIKNSYIINMVVRWKIPRLTTKKSLSF